MNSKIKKLLNGQGENYIFPFFWQHGEDEATLRKYMEVIYDSNVRAVCVESRPHPDFCGPKWWTDMDIILDEARARGMKVWILDDSHFPTGFANGAMVNAPAELCRQSIVCQKVDAAGKSTLKIGKKMLQHPRPFKKTATEFMIERYQNLPTRKYDDDQLVGIFAMSLDAGGKEMLDLSSHVKNDAIEWNVPDGKWRVYVLHLSRNYGFHRTYINLMDQESCRVLIDAVYEPHYAHYKDDFGKTIAGFFSDESELGNGKLFNYDNQLGTDQDLPWSRGLPTKLEDALGPEYAKWLPLLWENEADSSLTAKVRYAYMDGVTRLVERNFSWQIGEWCSNHDVEYIGHVIEDNNEHARTGSSLGHFFRGLSGQHMAGVDVVTTQVLPQAEDLVTKGPFGTHDHEFYHFVLAKLASSHAAIDPLKNGRAMCELFGNYGWSLGVRLEKYLADHFMVRGINHFVPHAFSPKKFPDFDSPPHFYADGNDAQFRHFGSLMAYMNRVCELISDGRHIAPVALLYHGEAEWTGKCMLMQKPARLLTEHQINFDILPQDVFLERERYQTEVGTTLRVNTQEYQMLVIPTAQFVTQEFAQAVNELHEAGFSVLFIDQLPEGICNSSDVSYAQTLLDKLHKCDVVALDQLIQYLQENRVPDLSISPASSWIRHLHYHYEDGSELYYFVNEGIDTYCGTIQVSGTGACYAYNAWENCLEAVAATQDVSGSTSLKLELDPLKSVLVIFDCTNPEVVTASPVKAEGKKIEFTNKWLRSICPAIQYPNFKEPKAINLPDQLAEEKPKFSGFVHYKNSFHLDTVAKTVLEITDAHEGVEVFINGQRVGLQIVPPYRFDISAFVQRGENHLQIEVATTLERQVGRKGLLGFLMTAKPSALSGITGDVNIYIS